VALAVVGNVMNCHSNVGPGYVPRRDIQPIVSGQGTEFLAQLNTWKFANFEPQPVP
jgi:hypothetical protein